MTAAAYTVVIVALAALLGWRWNVPLAVPLLIAAAAWLLVRAATRRRT